jgi:hypothetical protein
MQVTEIKPQPLNRILHTVEVSGWVPTDLVGEAAFKNIRGRKFEPEKRSLDALPKKRIIIPDKKVTFVRLGYYAESINLASDLAERGWMMIDPLTQADIYRSDINFSTCYSSLLHYQDDEGYKFYSLFKDAYSSCNMYLRPSCGGQLDNWFYPCIPI